jgi:two-component system, NarL family, sensor histidine kinase UhpB
MNYFVPAKASSLHGRGSARRDLAMVMVFAGVVWLLSARFELSEWLRAVTAPLERYQLDELPNVLLALVAGLVWFAWRRVRVARGEITERRRVEARLAEVVKDNQRLTREYVRAQEAERRSLARELHDELGQYVNAIQLDAVAIREATREATRDATREPNNRKMRDAHDASLAVLSSASHLHGVVRDLVRRMRPVGLDELGLVVAMQACLASWRDRLPNTQFEFRYGDGLDNLGEALNITLYRLMQEGLTNISKHAEASRVTIEIDRLAVIAPSSDQIHFTMTDDGRGVQLEYERQGLGLVGMRERIDALGGSLELVSAPRAGFSLYARIPARQQ